ncbi:substrate-binding domain-containing protein [Streptomyces sp. ODS28]|uniref:PstS family phosphate ABC transporter substrate-binding protein n=1 Tax=Streptomyces sp. ODS28 TaxID=3136688 RepID=UPI0031E9D2E8
MGGWDWWNAENVIAVGGAVVGVLATVGVLAYERLMPGNKRIGYRVQMDAPVGGDRQNGQADVRLGLFGEAPEMSDASLVLLRIENDGLRAIGYDDYTSPELTGLTVTFEGRTVTGVAVTEPSSDHLMTHFGPLGGLRHEGGVIHVPKVPLNRGEHYKLLVLLTGAGVGDAVTVSGGIEEGAVKRNRRLQRPSNRIFALIGLLSLLLVAEPLVLTLGGPQPTPAGCAKGRLEVTGSTAFAPALKEAAAAYEKECPGSHITVRAQGSGTGLRGLVEKGQQTDPEKSPPLIAFSDGPKPPGHPELQERRVATSLFTMVVNERAGVRNLSTAQVRRIYAGKVRNWKDLDGNDVPVRLVSRGFESGTREVFQRRILDRRAEPTQSSRDCVRREYEAPAVRCEVGSTQEVLRTVADVPGAIGYAEAATAKPQGLRRLRLDDRAATPEAVRDGRYPYRETEYAYTYRSPSPSSLTSQFLTYLTQRNGTAAVRRHGHLPCGYAENQALCAR